MTFRVGQKVVCVGQCNREYSFEVIPAVGEIYTIRKIVDYPDGISGLILSEIRNRKLEYADGYGELDFSVRKFRPLVQRKTDISVFTAMLNTTKHQVGV